MLWFSFILGSNQFFNLVELSEKWIFFFLFSSFFFFFFFFWGGGGGGVGGGVYLEKQGLLF